MTTPTSIRLDDVTLARVDALAEAGGLSRSAWLVRTVELAAAPSVATTTVDLDAETLAMLNGMIRGRDKGRADRGIVPDSWSRAQAIRQLLDDRIGFRSHEAVAISKLAATD